MAKVEWHPGELCPTVGFIVTNLARPAERPASIIWDVNSIVASRCRPVEGYLDKPCIQVHNPTQSPLIFPSRRSSHLANKLIGTIIAKNITATKVRVSK